MNRQEIKTNAAHFRDIGHIQIFGENDKDFVNRCQQNKIAEYILMLQEIKYEDIAVTIEHNNRKKYNHRIIIDIRGK